MTFPGAAIWRATSAIMWVGLAACSGSSPVVDDATGDHTSSSTISPGTTATSESLTVTTATDDSSGPGSSTSTSTSTSTTSTGTSTGVAVCSDLQSAITAAAMLVHLEALDAIATANQNNRAVGTPGYDQSADYVRAQLEAAGYAVTPHEFAIYVFEFEGPMSLTWEGQQDYVELTDFQVPRYSDAGTVSAVATPIDVQLGLGNRSTSGCKADDFAGFSAGGIALLQRGTCEVQEKILNAQAAGAAGALVFNQGNADDTTGLWWTNLGALTEIQIPVLLTTYSIGAAMAQASTGSVVVTMDVDVTHELRPTATMITETPGGDPDEIILLGAHLDSVDGGPGINDNGSAVAALLEVAKAIHDCETTRKVRFAWWTAEEVGLIGSTVYVESLDAVERDAIATYMNFDMIGSPNYGRFRFDGDGSAFNLPGPMGSAELEQVFADYFDGLGLDTDEIPFGGRSDYQAFVDNGIAAGGLHTGAEALKSAAQAEAHGGEADVAFDACYHRACDTVDNVNLDILESMGRAIAHALELYALP